VHVTRVVSGGQTGADRAALDAAGALGIPYGGWCPAGGWAEDLTEPPGLLRDYPLLSETPPGPPSTRTRWNVRDSDATLVLLPGQELPSGGTRLTVEVAAALGRPCLVTGAEDREGVSAWLGSRPDGLVLNVAGPRESEAPGLYAAVYRMLTAVLR
jgi:Circularly permutated YpsA SLOG family